MKTLYDNVKETEIFSPLSRSWFEEGFNESDLTMCNIKLSSISEEKKVGQVEFVNSADLTQKQLFNFNNQIDAIDTNDKDNLVCGALKHIMSMLTIRFLKHKSQAKTGTSVEILRNIMNINKKLFNYKFTDQVLRTIYSLSPKDSNLISEILSNFSYGSRNTVTLIP